jgi:CRISPR-associated protein Cas1
MGMHICCIQMAILLSQKQKKCMEIHINTYGTSLRILEGLLSIKWQNQINQVPLGKIKTISLTKGINVSTDVIYTCLDMGIDIIITERSGAPAGRLWNNRFGSISTIRKNQLDFANKDKVTGWVIENIAEKMENQAELISCFLALDDANSTLVKQTIARFSTLRERLYDYRKITKEEAFARIRALEGQASKVYFDCVNHHLPMKYQFAKRSKRPAKDITNSMLNYCYGMLYGHVESALVKAGLDPYIGFFHVDDYNRPVLTYDLIEPFRPWADWVVFHLCMNEIIDESYFEISDGGYWLVGDGKRILIQHFVDYFEEVIDYQDLHFSRMVHLEKRAQALVKIINKD